MHQTGIISYKYATITDSPQEVRVTDKEILYDIEQWFVLILHAPSKKRMHFSLLAPKSSS